MDPENFLYMFINDYTKNRLRWSRQKKPDMHISMYSIKPDMPFLKYNIKPDMHVSRRFDVLFSAFINFYMRNPLVDH